MLSLTWIGMWMEYGMQFKVPLHFCLSKKTVMSACMFWPEGWVWEACIFGDPPVCGAARQIGEKVGVCPIEGQRATRDLPRHSRHRLGFHHSCPWSAPGNILPPPGPNPPQKASPFPPRLSYPALKVERISSVSQCLIHCRTSCTVGRANSLGLTMC